MGDSIAAGACNGKVRAMMDDKGRRVKEAGPSTPVEILGLGDVPNAGEILMSFESDKEAKNFAGAFVTENKSTSSRGDQRQSFLWITCLTRSRPAILRSFRSSSRPMYRVLLRLLNRALPSFPTRKLSLR